MTTMQADNDADNNLAYDDADDDAEVYPDDNNATQTTDDDADNNTATPH
jgi:hypothetical protein